MKKVFILLIVLIAFSCSHIPKPRNPFRGKKKEEREKTVVIGGIKYKKIPIRDEKGNVKGYRYIRVGGKTPHLTPRPQPKVITKIPAQTPKRGIPYYKRHGTVFKGVRKVPPYQEKTFKFSALPQFVKKKIVFLEFEDYTGQKKESWGKIIPQTIEDLIEKTGKIRGVDQEEVFSVLGIRSKRELIKPENLMRIGEVFSVQAVVDGEVLGIYLSKYRETFESPPTSIALAVINIKIYDTLSGSLIKSFTIKNSFFMTEEKGKFSEEKSKLKAVELVANKAAKKIMEELDALPWWSRVIKVEGDKVYINSGRLTGVKIGDIFAVKGLGKYIVDELTKRAVGRVIGKEKAKIKVIGYVGSDKALCKVVEGDSVSVNDIVTKTKL